MAAPQKGNETSRGSPDGERNLTPCAVWGAEIPCLPRQTANPGPVWPSGYEVSFPFGGSSGAPKAFSYTAVGALLIAFPFPSGDAFLAPAPRPLLKPRGIAAESGRTKWMHRRRGVLLWNTFHIACG